MKRLLLILALILPVCTLRAADLEWLVDLSAASKKAMSEDKAILLNFTGPDDASLKLKQEVFEDPEFVAFAKVNLVAVEVDLTPDPKQSEPKRKAIEKLVREFDVEGAPMTFIMDKTGARLAKAGYVEGGARNYVSLMQKIPGFHSRPYTVDTASKGFTNLPEKAESPFVLLVPVINYNDVLLKGLSFGQRKTALINNKTLGEGESTTLRLVGKTIRIELLQIREASVVIQVEGESSTRILALGQRFFAEPKATRK